jgi:hypothetical protein
MRLTFVTCTGRCGSTLLTSILNDHRDVLSVSEFFSALKAVAGGREFPSGYLHGSQLWGLLAQEAPGLTALLRSGLKLPEMRYEAGRSQFTVETGIPLAYHSLLPMLSDDPDALFAQLARDVPSWPIRPAADQYRAFFRYLAGLYGRTVVVERSATTSPLIPLLRRLFPEAGFVHMRRNGPDCVLSMSRHPAFRREALIVTAMRKAAAAGVSAGSLTELAERMPEFKGVLEAPYDPDAFRAYPVPVAFFAERYWTPMERKAAQALGELPPERWTGLNYEDLLAAPREVLTELAEFIGVRADRDWLERAERRIDPGRPASAAAALSAAELAEVEAACAPAAEAIGQVFASHGTLGEPALTLGGTARRQ